MAFSVYAGVCETSDIFWPTIDVYIYICMYVCIRD